MKAISFSANFEKAFDSIEHPFLFATLKSFGFGTDFIQWVRTFLCKAESCVMNNGHSTGHFPLERGAHQGDPLSAHLFILVLETLFIQIRENEEIQGIRIDTQGDEVKISTYADDGNFLVLNTHSLNLIFQTCHSFKQFSSLKLNLEESEACWIGSARGKQDKPVDCNWINLCTDKIRTLGVFNSYDTDLADTHNFFSVIGKIKNCLNLWSSRGFIHCWKNTNFQKFGFIKSRLHFNNEKFSLSVYKNS